MAAFSGTGSA